VFISGFIEVVPHLQLPLSPLSFLSGDAGSGMSVPLCLPFDNGVIVSRKGLLSAHSYDLDSQLWAQPVDEWPMPIDYEDRVFVGVQQGGVVGFDKRTGEQECKIPIPNEGFLQAVSQAGPIIRHRTKDQNLFEAFDWSGRSLWRHGSFGTVIPTPGICLIRENLGESLAALEESTGNLLWRFSAVKTGDCGPGDISNEITGGLPSVVVLGDSVIVVVFDGRVFNLDRTSGEILSQGRTLVNGSFQVTPTSVVFAQPFCFSEFDHREMREVNRLEYSHEVKPLYGRQPHTLNAFCFSDESVVWTTMHGVLMGVSRESSPQGTRLTWMDKKIDALMPKATPPLIWGGYLYFREMVATSEGSSGLLCYRGTP
jgi:PQQ-like domain